MASMKSSNTRRCGVASATAAGLASSSWTRVPFVPVTSTRRGNPGNAAVDASMMPKAPFSNSSSAQAVSSISMWWSRVATRPVARVTGRVATRLHHIEMEDTACALPEFENGAFGIIEASTAAFPGFPRRVEVTGTKGTLVHELEARPAAVADATPHRRVFEDFIDAIKNDRAPACDGREGRRSVALIEAIYRSAKTGRTETP